MHDFSFLETSYQGFEEEVLRLRNRNRAVPQTRSYLDWRYLGQETQTPPEILWVQAPSGVFVGMASLISRPYWIDNKKYEFMVVGDISLDKEYRGTGLADEFFHYMNKHIRSKKSPCALVIPNMAAGKVLARCGWQERERLVHYVLMLNLEKKIYSFVKSRNFSKVLNKGYLFLLHTRLKAIQIGGLSFHVITKFGKEFDVFWDGLDKDNICLRDRTRQSLQWRYCYRPGCESFLIATGHSGNELVAYLIYSINDESNSLTVYDVMATEEDYLYGLVKLFVNYLQEESPPDSIRIVLNQGHPYSSQLKKMGFAPRKGEQLIQISIPECPAETPLGACQWLLTAGDKDV